jgi:cytidylate kinase
MIITIDGLSTNGKTTLAKLLAKTLNYKSLNSGSIYRALTLYILNNKLDMNNINDTLSKLDNANVEIIENNVYLNGTLVTNEIRSNEVSLYSAKYANIKQFKEYVNKYINKIVEEGNLVIEGRDVGTRVVPNADYKFYLYSDFDVRVKRLASINPNMSEYEIRASLQERDTFDINGGNFVKPTNAISINTTNYTLEEVYNIMLNIIKGE